MTDEEMRMKKLFWKMQEIIWDANAVERPVNSRATDIKFAYISERELKAFQRLKQIIRDESLS